MTTYIKPARGCQLQSLISLKIIIVRVNSLICCILTKWALKIILSIVARNERKATRWHF